MRGWRKKNRVSDLQRLKKRARDYTQYRVRKGVISRASICWICGRRDPTEAHHLDYRCPWMVEWICRPCLQMHLREEKAKQDAADWAHLFRKWGIKVEADQIA
jgi:hypothetical protein